VRRGGRVLRALAIAGAVALGLDQLAQHTVLADGVLFGRFLAPFDPPVFTARQLGYVDELRAAPHETAASFDAELGWCPRPGSTWLHASFDDLGARVGAKPHGPRPAEGARRVVAIGCSYTMAMEVADDEAWPARIEAERDGVELVNLGVAGFGIDQSYLRYLRDARELGADEVWLGVMPEAVARVTTLYTPTCQRWAPTCAFKPRFELDDAGELRPIASPASDPGEARRLLIDQGAFVEALGEHDLWVRRTPAAYAPRGSSLLHRFATTRIALTLYERRGLSSAALLDDPDGEVARLTLALLTAQRDACREDGAVFRVALLPSRPDSRGEPYWDALAAALVAEGIDCFDVAPALRAAGGAEADELWMRGGHYSPAGNAVVADALATAWLE